MAVKPWKVFVEVFVARLACSFFWVTKAKASTVPEEHVKDPWYFMWHAWQ